MTDDRIDVKVGAQTGELKTGMDEAAAKVQESTNKMQAAFQDKSTAISSSVQQMTTAVKSGLSGLETAVASVTGALGLLMGVLGGGKILKDAVDEFVNLNLESKKLSMTMGSSVQDAAAMINAYERMGVSGDTVSQAMRLLEKNIKANGPAIVDMGQKVGVNINLNDDLTTTYFKVIEALGEYEVGHKRNQASLVGFGARVQNVNALLLVTPEALEKSREELIKLGLTMDDVSVAKARDFKAGMHDVNLQFDAMKYKIGEGAIPMLTSLGRALIWVTNCIREMVVAEGSAEAGIAVLGGQGPPVDRKLTYPPPATSEKKQGASYNPPGAGGAGAGGGGKSRLQEWQEELERLREDENQFLDFSKSQEREYWQAKLELCQEGSQEYYQIKHRVFQLSKDLEKEALQQDLADLSLRQASEKADMAQRLALEDQKVALLGAKYGQDSMEYKKGLQAKQQLQNQAEKEEKQLEERKLQAQLQAAQAEFELERQKASFRRDMGLISATEEITTLKQLKEQELLLEQTTLEQIKAIWQGYPKEMQRLDDQMVKFKQKSALELEKVEEQAAKACQQKWQQVMAPLNQAVSTSIQGMMQGTQRLSQVINNALQNILTSYLGMAAQRLTNWVATELAMTASSLAGAATRTTVETAASTEGKAVKVASGLQGIGTDAAEGAAAAFKAMAGIPVIGPALGALAAAATFTAIIAYKTMIPSAAGGWDIPADSLAYVHKKEMILPEGLAQRIRTMTSPAPGAPMAAPGPSFSGDIHLHIPAHDGQSVKTFFKNNRDLVVGAVRDGIRDGMRIT